MRATRTPDVAWLPLCGIAIGVVSLHAWASTRAPYGFMPDELYFLDCADRLAWGYVDHPPLSIAWLRLWVSAFGDSLPSLRVAAGSIGAAAAVATGLLARELGGGRFAQTAAALLVWGAPVLSAMAGYYSMNVLDPLLWVAAGLCLVRIENRGHPRSWLALGLVLGLALLNKPSALWLGAGIAVALLATRLRSWLATPWPWLAGLVSLALFAPHLLWQWSNGWPTWQFLRAGAGEVMVSVSLWEFVRQQLGAVHPVNVPFCLAGLAALFAAPGLRAHSSLGWVFVSVATILAASGVARIYYLAPGWPLVMAAAGWILERGTARAPGTPWLRAALFGWLGCAVVTGALFTLPLLDPERYRAFEAAVGLDRPAMEFEEGRLPVHLALRVGWPQLVRRVADAADTLPPGERARSTILATSFGEAAALRRLGEDHDLPPVLGTHNSYWLWGPGAASGEILLALADPDADAFLREQYAEVRALWSVDCELCIPELARRVVYVCRGPRSSLSAWWPALKSYR